MAGVKGRSGRRSLADWEKRLKIIDKAWEITEKFLSDETQPIEKRIEVAVKVIVKDMPDKLTDGDGDPLPAPVILINTRRNDNSSENTDVHTREGIGSPEQAIS